MSKHHRGQGISLETDKLRSTGRSWWMDAPQSGFTAEASKKYIAPNIADGKMAGVAIKFWPKRRTE